MTGIDYAGFAVLIFVAGAMSTYVFGKILDIGRFVRLTIIERISIFDERIALSDHEVETLKVQLENANHIRVQLTQDFQNDLGALRDEFREDAETWYSKVRSLGKKVEKLEAWGDYLESQNRRCEKLIAQQIETIRVKNADIIQYQQLLSIERQKRG